MRKFLIAVAVFGVLGCEDDSEPETDGLGQATVTRPATEPATPPATDPAPAASPAPAQPPGEGPSIVPPAAAATGVEFEALPREIGAAFCEKMFECCGPGEAMSLILGTQLTRDNCPMLAPFYFGDYFEKRTLSIAEKRVSYFPDKVAACVAKLSARSCKEFSAALYTNRPYYYATPARPLDPAVFSCPELFGPDQKADQLCQNDYECVDGHCVNTIGTDKRCRSFALEGQACGYSSSETRCAPPLVCLGGGCRKSGKLGERCYDSYSELSCEAGLYCASGVCQTKLADGAACSWSNACLSGNCYYTPPNYASPMVCQPSLSRPPSTPTQACTGPE